MTRPQADFCYERFSFQKLAWGRIFCFMKGVSILYEISRFYRILYRLDHTLSGLGFH